MLIKQLALSSLVAFLALNLTGFVLFLMTMNVLGESRLTSLYPSLLPELAVSAVAFSALYLYTAPRRRSLLHGALFGALAGLLVLATHSNTVRASLAVGGFSPLLLGYHIANVASWAAAGLLVAWVSRKVDASSGRLTSG